MQLALILIIVGILIAALAHGPLGVAVILIGLVLLIWPSITGGPRPR